MRIVARLADRLDQVAQQRLAGYLPQAVGHVRLDRVAGELDDRTLRRNHQSRVVWNERYRMREGGPETAEQREQQDEMQDLPQGVEATPEPAEQTSQCAQHADGWRLARRQTPPQTFDARRSLPVRSRR